MKTIMTALLILTLCSIIWCDLQTYYKKGRIILKASDDFGKGNDWESIFYDAYKDMVVAPDGSIFVANSRTHNVYKFDQNGQLLKTFGRHGAGPGDLIYPGNLSILDNKNLMIAENSENLRFSIWNLNGEHFKVVKTTRYIFYLTAMINNRAAYYIFNQYGDEKNGYQEIISIILRDINSNEEIILQKVVLLNRSRIKLGPGLLTDFGNYFGEVFLKQTKEGNLAVGVSNQPLINIYSPKGKIIHSFSLKIKPVAVTKQYINEFKDHVMDDLKKEGEEISNAADKFWHENYMRTLPKYDFSTIFDQYLPLYKEILVDSDGNFLVFKYTECQRDCTPVMEVYSPNGEFICETLLDTGIYELVISRKFKRICFTKDGIFALVMEKGDEDEVIKLIKSNYIP